MRREFGRGRWLLDTNLALYRAVAVALGYAAAVFSATLSTVLHLSLLSVLPDNGAWGSVHTYLSDGPVMLLGGLALTAPLGLPGFLLAVTAVAMTGRRDRVTLALAGGLNAFAALGLSGYLFGGAGGSETYFMFCCFGGGLAGGYAHWLIAESLLPPVPFLLPLSAPKDGSYVSAPARSESSARTARTRRRRDSP